MAKKKQSSQPLSVKNDKIKAEFSIDNLIPENYQLPLLFVLIGIVFLITYFPMFFGGMTFQSGDIITSNSVRTFLDSDREGYTLWFPYIFGGMPAYGLATGFKWFNIIWVIFTSTRELFTSVFSVDYTKWAFYLLILSVSSFFLARHITRNNLISLFVSLTTSFSTGIVLFLYIGHVTKLVALAFLPLIFLFVLRLSEKPSLRDFLLLVIFLQLSFLGWHVQIIFYSVMFIGSYFIFYFIKFVIEKKNNEIKNILKTAGYFLAAFTIAILIQSDNLTQIYEWNPYSTRGTESITDLENKSDIKKKDTDFYNYATNWSFSPEEIITFVVPSYYGFGNSKYKGPASGNNEVEVNTYFGQMPFVDSAMYMGSVVFIFALFSIYLNRKNPLVIFMASALGVFLLISFGRNFSFVYDLLFNFLPFFDKFRVPSMILVLLQVFVPLLAALGIKKLIEDRDNVDIQKIVKIIAIGLTVIFLFILLMSNGIIENAGERIQEYSNLLRSSGSQRYQIFLALKEYISEMIYNDLWINSLLITISFWSVYLYLNKTISKDIMLVLIILFSMTDLFRINERPKNYQKDQDINMLFKEPDYVKFIKSEDNKEPFRVFNAKADGSMGSINQNQNFNSYFLLEDFYGYSSLKPRAYQDYMDVVGPLNESLWDLYNVKYLITERPYNNSGYTLLTAKEGERLYRNDNFLSRAFFVNELYKGGAFNFLTGIKNNNINVEKTALLEDHIKIDTLKGNEKVSIGKYTETEMVIKTTNFGNNLLVISNTFFPKGWEATVNGKPTEILKTNHSMMGIILSAGENEIILSYQPKSFFVSKYLSLILSSLTILALLVTFIKRK